MDRWFWWWSLLALVPILERGAGFARFAVWFPRWVCKHDWTVKQPGKRCGKRSSFALFSVVRVVWVSCVEVVRSILPFQVLSYPPVSPIMTPVLTSHCRSVVWVVLFFFFPFLNCSGDRRLALP
ncbi:uncharacterized protein BDZ83DRAFT_40583 [Colletotrichum acutatum]|uniref:Uncharacterized protein n=1 Tax=Glomerella acutata TaxID=27357 RepID=A0AAD8UFN0_GLOAC|nr:uncharacterized protein BDZ83DRAFT_40583 [Colletotrichum acutatum]KAK1716721.1 hypothetical protein BDZ83DRAFT_40583 [Colletotrichum acutatum]